MKLSYIFHSGFLFEFKHIVLVLDYWMDPINELLQKFKQWEMEGYEEKHVYVFASHFHEDHFTKKIFEWKSLYKNIDFTYILSKDILKHGKAQSFNADVWLAKGGHWSDDRLNVIACGSNDSGVSWVIEAECLRIFHAGDLCNWYARFLAEDNIPQTIFSQEFGEINPIAEEKHYLGELKDVARLTKEFTSLPQLFDPVYFDYALFPVDGRVGNGYTLGGRQFIERFKIGMFVPMHFVMSGFESAWRMEPFCRDRHVPFWSIGREGDSIEQNGDMIIRKSVSSDIPDLQEIFACARRFMASTGNPNQWADTYPSKELMQSDIASGDSYICLVEGSIVATFVLRGGNDPTYDVIYEGAWPNDRPYATIHRIASNGNVKGIFSRVLDFALKTYDTIRIDTHRDNRVMQSLLDNHGFVYCGIIHCWNGDERLAYILSQQCER